MRRVGCAGDESLLDRSRNGSFNNSARRALGRAIRVSRSKRLRLGAANLGCRSRKPFGRWLQRRNQRTPAFDVFSLRWWNPQRLWKAGRSCLGLSFYGGGAVTSRHGARLGGPPAASRRTPPFVADDFPVAL